MNGDCFSTYNPDFASLHPGYKKARHLSMPRRFYKPSYCTVMPGLVPGIHAFSPRGKSRRGWPGLRPAMTLSESYSAA
jgi:hypothetical protein